MEAGNVDVTCPLQVITTPPLTTYITASLECSTFSFSGYPWSALTSAAFTVSKMGSGIVCCSSWHCMLPVTSSLVLLIQLLCTLTHACARTCSCHSICTHMHVQIHACTHTYTHVRTCMQRTPLRSCAVGGCRLVHSTLSPVTTMIGTPSHRLANYIIIVIIV